jgi:hypothetical protein
VDAQSDDERRRLVIRCRTTCGFDQGNTCRWGNRAAARE